MLSLGQDQKIHKAEALWRRRRRRRRRRKRRMDENNDVSQS